MNNRLVIFLLLSISVLYFTACTSDKLAPVEIECVGETPVWEGEVAELIAVSCAYAECHISGTSAPGNYLTYQGISSILRNGSFKNRVFDIKDNPTLGMPPEYSAGPKFLTDAQLSLLSCWMEGGFLEN